MGRVYTAAFKDVAATAAIIDVFEIAPATDKPVSIISCYVSQSDDVGDAAEEGILIEIVRGNTTTGSGGATLTSRAMDQANTAAGATVKRMNTTEASAGTEHSLHAEVWNVRTPFVFMPVPEARPRGSGSAGRICVRMIDTPADSLTISGTLIFEEL